MRRVIYLPSATRDLRDLWRHIAKDSAFYASRYVDHLMARVDHLAELSQPGRIREDVRRPGVRGYTERSHLILFVLTDDTLTVLRIVHGARDIKRIRFD